MPRLSPGAFNAFLSGPAGIGQDFLWRRASACPCVSRSSGAASPKCPKCSGKGQLWAAPVRGRAGLSQMRASKEFAQMGQWESGDAMVAVPENSPLYQAGQFDRLTLLNAEERFSLVLVRGEPSERVYRTQIIGIERVFWYAGPLNDGGSDVVEGSLPQVSGDGELTWGAAGAPPVGKQYTIEGWSRPEYYVWNAMPSTRNEHFGARLPKKLPVRRFDLFGR